MKKVITCIVLAGVLITSCADNGKKTEAKEAQKVDANKTSNTINYTTIKEGSTIQWRASHLGGVQKRHGNIYLKDATFSVDNKTLINAIVTVDMGTLTVENFPAEAPEKAKLTGHLKSADFFNIEQYPSSKFELIKAEPSSGDYNTKLTGNLTILNETKSISFLANLSISENEIHLVSEDFSVNRTDWGLTYNTAGTAGVPVDYLISNDVGFTINVTVFK